MTLLPFPNSVILSDILYTVQLNYDMSLETAVCVTAGLVAIQPHDEPRDERPPPLRLRLERRPRDERARLQDGQGGPGHGHSGGQFSLVLGRSPKMWELESIQNRFFVGIDRALSSSHENFCL